MFITPDNFDTTLSQLEIDKIMNELLVNVHGFSDIACLDGRIYGVTTLCQSCDLDINYCIRNEIPRALHSSQIKTERKLGYDISSKYHHAYRIPFGYVGKLQLPHRNIEVVNVEQSIEIIEGYEGISISPYIQEDIDIIEEDGFCVAVVNSSLIGNPKYAMIRDEDGLLYEQQEKRGYPKKVSGNWHIPIMRLTSPCSTVKVFNAQHCRFIRVEFTTPECGGDIYPVYPNTKQIIPTIKIETQANKTIFWFNVWVLARPEFMDDGIDISAGEFYKIFDTLDVACFSSVEKQPVLTVITRGNCEIIFEQSDKVPVIQIINAQDGVVYVDTRMMECCEDNLTVNYCISESYPAFIDVWYKTNPKLMENFNYGAIKQAISQWTAAELPTTACECTMERGFIYEAQTAFIQKTKNLFTGEVKMNVNYNDLYGRVRYYEILADIKKGRIIWSI